MSEDKMNIHLNDEDLENIRIIQQKAALVKHTTYDVSDAWSDFKPWQNSTIDWNNEYAVYASNSAAKNDVTGNLANQKAIAAFEYRNTDRPNRKSNTLLDREEDVFLPFGKKQL